MFGRIWRLFGGRSAMVLWRLDAAKKVGRNQDPKKVLLSLSRKKKKKKKN